MPIGPGLIRASYSEVRYRNVSSANQLFPGLVPNPKADKFALGYVYNLSKRSAVYATAAWLTNSNGAAQTLGGILQSPDHGARGTEFGLRHAF